jgi:uncharacterized Zn finger protein
MGRWDDFDDRWNYYRADQPIKVKGGLKTRNERGTIGSTWWSKRWITALESLSMGTRISRGRAYARQGQVLSMEIEPGQVKAKVQGSQTRPYAITIQLKPLSDADWQKVTAAMSSQALFAARLLAGEMPTNIEDAFASVQLSLFPTQANDLETSCSCPDWANPCKHIAAVYYLLAERFDEDPFLIFKLRGRSKEEIIQALREKRVSVQPTAAEAEATDSEPVDETPLLVADLNTFWQAGEGLDTFAIYPDAPRVDRAILKRLGDAPFTIDGLNLAQLLARAYDVVDLSITGEAEDEDE